MRCNKLLILYLSYNYVKWFLNNEYKYFWFEKISCRKEFSNPIYRKILNSTNHSYSNTIMLPEQFYFDNTLSRAPQGTTCPRCRDDQDVVQAYHNDELNKCLRVDMGCRHCHFRWLCGKGVSQKEKLAIFIK